MKPKRVFCFLALLLIPCLISCGSNNTGTSNQDNSTDASLVDISSYAPVHVTTVTSIDQVKIDEFVISYNNLAIDMYKYYVAGGDGNFVFGPYSFLQVLGMTALGAKTETIEEIKKAFYFGLEKDDWLNTKLQLGKIVTNVDQADISAEEPFTIKNIAWG